MGEAVHIGKHTIPHSQFRCKPKTSLKNNFSLKLKVFLLKSSERNRDDS